jgi:hypothetical protein
MGGNGTVTARLDLPGGDWSKANARFKIDCPTCTIGGDGVKIKPRTMTSAKAAWVGDGIEVPRMFIDRLQAEFVIAGGKFEMKQWDAVSPDGDLVVELSGTMAKSLSASKVDTGCIQFRGTDELAKREAKFHGSLDLIGGVLMPDGMRHLKVAGTLGTMKYLPKACDGATPQGEGGGAGEGGTRTRPSLSNVPDAPNDGNGNPGANAGNPGAGGTGTDTTAPVGTINEVPPGEGTLTPKVDDVRPAEHDAGPAIDPGLGGAIPPGDGATPTNGEGGTPEPEGTPSPSTGGADTAGPENGPPPVEGKEPPVENE